MITATPVDVALGILGVVVVTGVAYILLLTVKIFLVYTYNLLVRVSYFISTIYQSLFLLLFVVTAILLVNWEKIFVNEDHFRESAATSAPAVTKLFNVVVARIEEFRATI